MSHDRPTASQPQQLLTPDEVAALIGMPRLYVVRQSRAGKIPAIRMGKVYRYRHESIQRWLQEQETAVE